jgi:hypothetical protein
MKLKSSLHGLVATLMLLPTLSAADEPPPCDPMPKPLIKPVPKYPKIVAGPPRAHVTLRFTIGTDGWVTDAIVTGARDDQAHPVQGCDDPMPRHAAARVQTSRGLRLSNHTSD